MGQARYRAAKPQRVDGIYFPSKKEAARYAELKLLERAGVIRDLQVHRRFDLTVGETVIGQYEADFVYWANELGVVIVEDVKGWRTEMYKWKNKHFQAQYGIMIHEV